MNSNILFVISGPSGVGKGTLLGTMVKEDENLRYSVSATTRDMRVGEAEGVSYYYKTPEEFERLIEAGDVIEWDMYQGHKYGTLFSGVEKSLATGKNIALDITVPGAVNIKKMYGDRAVTVFVLPPSVEELKHRLINRNREGIEEIEKRLAFAIHDEMPKFKDFDYVVVNDKETVAVEQLFDILKAELTGNGIDSVSEFKTSNCMDILEKQLHISEYADKYKL